MNVHFINRNGQGGVVDESGNEHFEMDIDTNPCKHCLHTCLWSFLDVIQHRSIDLNIF